MTVKPRLGTISLSGRDLCIRFYHALALSGPPWFAIRALCCWLGFGRAGIISNAFGGELRWSDAGADSYRNRSNSSDADSNAGDANTFAIPGSGIEYLDPIAG